MSDGGADVMSSAVSPENKSYVSGSSVEPASSPDTGSSHRSSLSRKTSKSPASAKSHKKSAEQAETNDPSDEPPNQSRPEEDEITCNVKDSPPAAPNESNLDSGEIEVEVSENSESEKQEGGETHPTANENPPGPCEIEDSASRVPEETLPEGTCENKQEGSEENNEESQHEESLESHKNIGGTTDINNPTQQSDLDETVRTGENDNLLNLTGGEARSSEINEEAIGVEADCAESKSDNCDELNENGKEGETLNSMPNENTEEAVAMTNTQEEVKTSEAEYLQQQKLSQSSLLNANPSPNMEKQATADYENIVIDNNSDLVDDPNKNADNPVKKGFSADKELSILRETPSQTEDEIHSKSKKASRERHPSSGKKGRTIEKNNRSEEEPRISSAAASPEKHTKSSQRNGSSSLRGTRGSIEDNNSREANYSRSSSARKSAKYRLTEQHGSATASASGRRSRSNGERVGTPVKPNSGSKPKSASRERMRTPGLPTHAHLPGLTGEKPPMGDAKNEVSNFAVLCHMLLDGGRIAMREVFDSIHPPMLLQEHLGKPQVGKST